MHADECTLMNILANPFGAPSKTSFRPAARPGTLEGGPVILFDNGKIRGSAVLGALFEAIGDAIRARFPAAPIAHAAAELNDPALDIQTVARSLAERRAAGVVIALVDHGVSHRSIALARQLEEAGTPCCLVASGPGAGLARAVADAQCPGLRIIDLPIQSHDSRASVAALATAGAGDIIAALAESVPATTGAQISEPSFPVLEAGDGGELLDTLTGLRLGDGLPVVPPTRARVRALLDTAGRDPAEILHPGLIPSGIPITLELLAANAVMAGCTDMHFPIVLAAFEAMCAPEYRLSQAAITSHPSGNLVLVSGPEAQRRGIAGGAGCLGPGHRANASIGRAITLTLINVGRIRPGEADLACFGSAAEFSYCLAENIAESPWSGLHAELLGPERSCVIVHRCEAPHTVVHAVGGAPEVLLESVASVAATLGANNAYLPAELIVLLNPEHAHLVARAGWTKSDVRQFLWEAARNPRARLTGRGTQAMRPAEFADLENVPVVRRPEEIVIVVAGGPGPHSMVASPWGLSSLVCRPL